MAKPEFLMEQNPNPLADPKFYFITAFSTALAFGCMLAFLFSLRDIRNDLTFDFSIKTVIMFVIGAALGWGFWAAVRKYTSRVK
jgi:hypothetical protein